MQKKQQLVFRRVWVLLILLISAFLIPQLDLVTVARGASDSETDLRIPPETITQRSYFGTAVTDKYDVEILTEESYQLAKEIAARQEQAYRTAQETLFAKNVAPKQDDPVAAAAEQFGLFGDSYALSETVSAVNAKTENLWLVILVLMAGTGVGISLAVVLQKRKRGRAR